MNSIISKTAENLKKCLDDYYTFDFNNELAERAVKEGLTLEKLSNNEDLAKLMNIGREISSDYPFFSISGSSVILRSKRFFEINRFALSVGAFARSVSQIISAESINEEKANQFKIFAYYSSIFQSITCFLALNNIVYIPKALSGLKLEKIEERTEGELKKEVIRIHPEQNQPVKGELSSEWNFKIAQQKHNIRWKEFSDILKRYLRNNWEDEIPDGVKKFWGYIKCIGEYKQNYWRDQHTYLVEFKDKQEFIDALNKYSNIPSEVRHQKIYEDRYYDLLSHSHIRKKEEIPPEFKESEISFFSNCAKDLIQWNYKNLKEIIDFIKSNTKQEEWDKALSALKSSVILDMSSTTVLRLNKFSEEVDKIDKNIIPFLKDLTK